MLKLSENQAPTADAGPDQTLEWTGGSVSYTGTGDDPDPGDNVSYEWSFVSVPFGSRQLGRARTPQPPASRLTCWETT